MYYLAPFRKNTLLQKNIYLGGIVSVITAIITLLYYLHAPYPETTVDSPSYLEVVKQLQLYGNPVHPVRLPVYPLMIVVVYLFAGQGNIMAVCIVQGILFVVTTLELYIIALFLFRQHWIAFCFGLLIGTNLILLSYCKPLMTEGLSLWLLTTSILLMVLFVRKPTMRLFMLLFSVVFCLIFTRPEWVFFPILLSILLFFVLKGQKILPPWFLPRMALSLATIYLLVGGYIAVNAWHSHFAGLTTVENMNMLGKVLQYRMQDEAPPHYQSISHRLDGYTQRGQFSPYVIFGHEPDLAANHGQVAYDFAHQIIVNHPMEFLLKSIPYFFSSLTAYYPAEVQQRPPSMFDVPVNILLSVHQFLYGLNALFPYCVLAWLLFACLKVIRVQPEVRIMGCIMLMTIYGIVITTLGGYFEHDYMRVHIVFDPLIQLTIVSTLLLGLKSLFAMCNTRHRRTRNPLNQPVERLSRNFKKALQAFSMPRAAPGASLPAFVFFCHACHSNFLQPSHCIS